MAAPCPPWLKQAFIGWLGPERIWELYGGTERYGRCLIRGDEFLTHRGSVGRISGGAKVKAIREDGEDCAVGEVGELYFLPPGGVEPSHYIGAEARRTADGWFSIGDLGHLDAEGYVYLADRRTDLILRGGANIYPAEVEAALDEHPAVASSLVVGLPSEDMGARVHAIVQLKPDAPASLGDIHQFLLRRLTRYKLPESYEISGAPLRDDAGKARRTAVRAERLEWLKAGRPFQLRAADLPRPARAAT
jgi:bile acid-coenzyme A ligase